MSIRRFGIQTGMRLAKFYSGFTHPTPLKLRKDFEKGLKMLGKPAKSVEMAPHDYGDVPGNRFTPPDPVTDTSVMYLHGGGYLAGSSQEYAPFLTRLAAAAGLVVDAIDYRLAPEHPYPAALDDSLQAYRAIVAAAPAKRVILMGDSAGGGLTLSSLHALRDAQDPLPVLGITLSAWTDLTNSGAAYRTRARADPMITHAAMQEMAIAYPGGQACDLPGISPLFGDFSGLPPLLMLVGDREVLLDDTTRVVQKVHSAGGEVTLWVEPKMHHDWLLFPMPEGRKDIQRLGSKIQRFLKSGTLS